MFADNANLDRIDCRAVVPPSIGGSAICDASQYETVMLTVPVGSTYAYRQADGWSEFFDIWETDDPGSGLLAASSPSISCRPSPARDVLEVTGTDAGMSCTIYDVSGVAVLSSPCSDAVTVLDVSRLVAGTYVLVVDSDGGDAVSLRFAKE